MGLDGLVRFAKETGFNHWLLFLCPPLVAWFTHRRLVRREYVILWVLVVACCAPLVALASVRKFLPAGRGWSSGILTLQVPASLFATVLLMHLEIFARHLAIRAFAVIAGMVLLVPTVIF
ncbi:MAG: hypothetical protein MUE73_05550 [Planctomycetes bacterium]|jgi:hypothetical protein|nr:hypothetical protein [Planctomycetota bacterium]